ncbi:PAS-domain containing protein [Undibacterium sp. Jales W-56]|uniref:PAS domain-containing sensor histidine kinase n=1 Tax=Undibacterium sp. Jales W-56 TaxID=2897325 RepID=UPI0021D0ECC5|nr:PAS-domain containing protein [Undibacterium sp. Jales W-56]MCU6434819.1 PAS-domain containing protein [Undibacterium sp. Jales W-56]
MTAPGNLSSSMFGAPSISREAIYKAMVEQSMDAMLVLEGTRFVDCNPSAERLYGTTREQFIKVSPIEFSPEFQPDGRLSLPTAREYVRLANIGFPQRFEWVARRLDGSVFPAEVGLSRLVDGGMTRTIVVIRDLSSQKLAEQAAREQNSTLQVLLDNFPGGVALIDESWHVVTWNQAVLKILDLPESLFEQGPPHIDTIISFNIQRGEFGQTVEEKFKRLLQPLEQGQVYAFERTRSDGKIVEIRSAPVSTGGFVMTVVDATNKRTIQREYKRQSLLLKTVLNSMPQGISVFDKDMKLQLWNQSFIDVLNYDPATIAQGTPFSGLLRIMAERGEYGEGEVDALIQERLALAMRFEAHRFERRRPNGHTHLVQGTPYYDEGELGGFITTYTDITDLKNTQLALSNANAMLEKNVADRTNELRSALDDLIRSEKLAALGSLVAGVAHELNTPIGNSLLISSTLRERTDDFNQLLEQGQLRRSDLQHYLEEARHASTLLERGLNHAADLISSFKQVAVDQASSKRRRFNLAKVGNDIIATVMMKIRQSGIKVHLDIAANIEMDSYPGPLEQVISNLIDNAILHGFESKIQGEVTLSAQLLGEAMVEIRFQDDGVGIRQDDVPRIFDPFFTTKLGQGGSGLGLNIVYNIVTSLLGGKIHVESNPGEGACFILQLPLCAPSEQN